MNLKNLLVAYIVYVVYLYNIDKLNLLSETANLQQIPTRVTYKNTPTRTQRTLPLSKGRVRERCKLMYLQNAVCIQVSICGYSVAMLVLSLTNQIHRAFGEIFGG